MKSKRPLKGMTIDEVTGSPPGTFKASLENAKSFFRGLEEERKARVRQARQKPKRNE